MIEIIVKDDQCEAYDIDCKLTCSDDATSMDVIEAAAKAMEVATYLDISIERAMAEYLGIDWHQIEEIRTKYPLMDQIGEYDPDDDDDEE